MKTSFPYLLILLAFIAVVSSCGRDEMDEMDEFEFVYNGTLQFSDADMAVLSKTLNLSTNPFNYAKPNLPRHFTEGEMEYQDNTPATNPVTDMGATLGRVLFYDKHLSANNTISCASCHQQAHGFSDPERFSTGFNGGKTRRNSMSLINARYFERGNMGWDEKSATLEEFVLEPIKDHVEMGMTMTDLESKLRQTDYYPVLFRNAFGDETITADRISKALAQFVRAIVSYDSKFDQGVAQAGFPEVDDGMPLLPNLTAQERLGQDIFFNGRNEATCKYCHGTPNLVIDTARNNGLEVIYSDKGKGEITGIATQEATFKVPSLRNIAQTAPYMHDGRFATLEEVVDHYSDNVQPHHNLHFRLSTIDDGPLGSPPMKLNLTQSEKNALVAFLKTFTDPGIATEEKYSDPFI